MKLNLDKVTLLTFISIAFLSCSTKEIPVTPEVTEKITYVKNVKSIVDNSCATSSCHDAVGPAAGLKLTTYSEVKSSAQNGNFHARIDNGSMPPSGALPSATKAIIDKWKTDGYLE
ncbi:MAG: hypothetical protein ACPGUU_02200 [Flavobacteriaceae bacterium]